MNDPKPGGPLDLPGVETRTAGLRGQTRLIVFGAVFIALILIGMLRHHGKALSQSDAVLQPQPNGSLVLRDAQLSLSLPAGWSIDHKAKPDELRVHNAAHSCRALVIHDDLDETPASFQQSMGKKMQQDGHQVMPQPAVVLGGRNAAHMRVLLSSGSKEEIYTIQTGNDIYTLITVQLPGCDEDLGGIAAGFRVGS